MWRASDALAFFVFLAICAGISCWKTFGPSPEHYIFVQEITSPASRFEMDCRYAEYRDDRECL